MVQVTHQSWLSRMKGALIGVLFGLAAFFGSFYLLWYNEVNTVDLRATYGAGQSVVVADTPNDSANAENNGKLIHTTGRVENVGTVADPEFGTPPLEAIRLNRVVETYQWKERSESRTEERVGGGTTTRTTYSYEKVWTTEWLDSRNFEGGNRASYQNPHQNDWRFKSAEFQAEKAMLGAFTVPWSLVGGLASTELTANQVLIRPDLKAQSTAQGTYFYFGTPTAPEIGDQRVSFTQIAPQDASILAQQTGSASFEPWVFEPTGKSIFELDQGILTEAQMFQSLQDQATLQMWGLRLGGFILMVVGLSLMLRPLRILGAIIPFIGRLVGGAILVFAVPVAACLTLVTIALAWLRARPEYAIPLLVIAAAFLIVPRLLRKKDQGAAAAADQAKASYQPPPQPPQAPQGGPPPLPPGA